MFMTIEVLEEQLNECQKALAELKESKKEGKWKPKESETYWFRDVRGAIVTDKFEPDCWSSYWRVKNIPIFETREECERYWHFMDTVKEKSYEFSREELVDSSITKWCIVSKRNSIAVDYAYDVGLLGGIYFKKPQDAKYIIDNFKEELLKYWI